MNTTQICIYCESQFEIDDSNKIKQEVDKRQKKIEKNEK